MQFKIETPPNGFSNLLIYGDNYVGLNYLDQIEGLQDKVRLVYIDPPYGTKQSFTITYNRSSTISRVNKGVLAYSDELTGDKYLKFLEERLFKIKTLMTNDSSIYLHIDCKIGHYVKIIMDKVFDSSHFINDITRIKCNPKNFDRKGFGNMKDMILFYSKTKKYIWNNPRRTPSPDELNSRFRFVDKDGRKYTTTPLHAPGETSNGDTGKPWRDKMPPPGRHWRYPPLVLNELDDKGLIEWSSTGNPRKKIYADVISKNGHKYQDIWEFKDPQSPKYPTEKNLELLKLIVQASSNPGDIVLDAFCGSGTTLMAAQELKRRWIGIDSSKEAISICKKRLNNFDFINLSKDMKYHEQMV